MILPDPPGLHRGGDMGQLRRQRRAARFAVGCARPPSSGVWPLGARCAAARPGCSPPPAPSRSDRADRRSHRTPDTSARGCCAPESPAARPSPPGTRCPPHHWTGSASRRKRTPPDRPTRETAHAPPAQSRIHPHPNAIHHHRQTSQAESDPHRICG